jgi:hypothetical protein
MNTKQQLYMLFFIFFAFFAQTGFYQTLFFHAK